MIPPSERLFRLLLLAYPGSFRRRYRDDLIAFFRAERASEKYGRGLAGATRFWTTVLLDLGRAAVTERTAVVIQSFGAHRARHPVQHVQSPSHRELPFMETLLQDIRYAVRTFARNPGFTLVVTATLALGIGINAAMFSIVDGVLLENLPYTGIDRIVMVNGTDTDGEFGVSENERLIYRRQTEIFDAFGTYAFSWINLSDAEGATRVAGAGMDEMVLPALGVTLPIGRGFRAEETQAGNDAVIVLSHGLWQERFGGEPGVVGRTMAIGDRELTVIGVAPRDFHLPGDFVGQPVQLYFPRVFGDPDPRNIHYLTAVGRLREEVSLSQARAHLEPLGVRMRTELPTLPPTFQPATVPVRELVLGEVRPVLLILLAAVGLVLLIACANVANLFLARAEGRGGEIAVRVALGAGRGRLVRQLMTESVLLAALGGALGLAFASLATAAVIRLDPPNVPRIDQLGMDATVVGFTVLVTAVTALLFGVVPALVTVKQGVRGALRGGGATGGAGRQRMRRGLVVAEVAVAMVLATGAGLLVRSFVRLQAEDPGLNPANVLTMQLTLRGQRYSGAQPVRAYYRDLLERIRGLPGVTRAGAISALPLASRTGDWGIRIEGREDDRLPSGRRPWADRIVATDGYFEALGVELVEGRTLQPGDGADGRQVVVINETAARRYWPGESALGKRFFLSANIDTAYRSIVGVTRDVRHGGLSSEPRPEMYLPHAQHSATQDFAFGTMNLVIRTAGDPRALVGAVRGLVRTADPEVPVSNVQTMSDVVSASTSTERLNVTLFTVFGALGLALVSVGVYGVMSYSISQRTKELGIRIALGAAPGSVLGLVVGHGLSLAVAGAAIGFAGALTLARLLSNLLYGVTWHDPVTFATVPAVVTTVALLACLVPALRATRVDPMRVLRTE